MEYGKIYYMVGPSPKTARHVSRIKEPPNAGWSHAFRIGEPDSKNLLIFCPFTFKSFNIPSNCMEAESFEPVEYDKDYWIDFIKKQWETIIKQGLTGDYRTAELVLEKLGGKKPKIEYNEEQMKTAKGTSGGRSGGKPVGKKLIAPVKLKSKRGQVLKYFEDESPKSLIAACSDLDMDRKNLLSQMFGLNKNHGIGYELMDGQCQITLPKYKKLYL